MSDNATDRDTLAHGAVTLRDHFAGLALQGLLASEAGGPEETPGAIALGRGDGLHREARDYAELAYELADAMLAVRAKGGAPC